MKRLVIAVALLLLPIAAQAFNPDKPQTIRIGILRNVSYLNDHAGGPVRSIPNALRDELRRAGFDAFTLDATFDDLERRDDRDADFYVEVAAANHYDNVYGGVDIYGRNGGIGIGVVQTNIAARINVYDGATLEVFARFDVDKSNAMVAPTYAGIGGRHAGIWLGLQLPLGYMQSRNTARAVAKTAAANIADAVSAP